MFTFERPLTLHFSDTDKEGILYFARLADLAHQALEDHLLETGHWKTWFDNSEYAIPIRATQLSFEKPMHAGETFNIRGQLIERSEHSITLEFLFVKGETCFARAKTTHVFVDRATGKKAPCPDWVKN